MFLHGKGYFAAKLYANAWQKDIALKYFKQNVSYKLGARIK